MKAVTRILLLWIFVVIVMAVFMGSSKENIIETVPNDFSKPITQIIGTTNPVIMDEFPTTTNLEKIKPIKPLKKTMKEVEQKWSKEAEYIAKTIWGEARGISALEQEKVVWCILNRVDSSKYQDTIIKVVTSGAFHGYHKSNPIWEEHYTLALEVIAKWLYEKDGGIIERPLASDYYYFSASQDGTYHIFRKEW